MPCIGLAAAGGLVLAIYLHDTHNHAYYKIERDAQDHQLFVASKIAEFLRAVPEQSMALPRIYATVSATHGHVYAVFGQQCAFQICFADQHRVERVVSDLFFCAHPHAVVVNSLLFAAATHSLFVYDLDNLSAPILKYSISPAGTVLDTGLCMQRDGTLCAITRGRTGTQITVFEQSGQKKLSKLFKTPAVNFLDPSAQAWIWQYLGDTLMVFDTKTQSLHWIGEDGKPKRNALSIASDGLSLTATTIQVRFFFFFFFLHTPFSLHKL